MFDLTYEKRNASQNYHVIQFFKLSDWYNSKTLVAHYSWVCEESGIHMHHQ